MAVDLVLPFKQKEVPLRRVEEVSGHGSNFKFFLFYAADEKPIRVYDYTARYLATEKTIVFHKTQIFNTVMSISDAGPTFTVEVAYLYRSLVMFPLILLATSITGMFYRKSVELPFNMSIISGMLIIIVLVLLKFV